VIAATHRDLRARAAEGKFREDLLWRLDVVHLHVPPLRDRREDIPVLARHFAGRFARRFGVPKVEVGDALVARLLAYDWPGNVRELEHTLERMIALSDDGELDPELIPGAASTEEAPALDLKSRVDAYERGLVLEALEAAHANRSEAARRLGISRVTLYDKLAKYGL
jgi:two-component system response regulator HydG